MNTREKIRVQIQTLFLSGKNSNEILEILRENDAGAAPSLSTIKYWVREAKWGNGQIQDRKRSGRPVSARSDGDVAKVLSALEECPKISTRVLSQKLGLPKTTIHRILTVDLDKVKMNARWVPKCLSTEEKEKRVRYSNWMIQEYGSDWEQLVSRLVTCDESWVLHDTPESRVGAAEWRTRGSQPPTQAKLKPGNKKIMASVFWDSRGVLLTKFLPSGATINGEYYLSLLEELVEVIRRKRPGLLRSGVIFLQDNATPHKGRNVIEFLSRKRWNVLPHSPYSPDLAPSDFFLFKMLKNFLRGRNFEDQQSLEAAVTTFFGSQEADFFRKPFFELKERLQYVIREEGSYVPDNFKNFQN